MQQRSRPDSELWDSGQAFIYYLKVGTQTHTELRHVGPGDRETGRQRPDCHQFHSWFLFNKLRSTNNVNFQVAITKLCVSPYVTFLAFPPVLGHNSNPSSLPRQLVKYIQVFCYSSLADLNSMANPLVSSTLQFFASSTTNITLTICPSELS